MTGRLFAPRGVAVAVLLVASLFLAVGCGGGGSSSGGGDTKGRDTTAVVLGLQTPLGLQGTRGVGPEVTVIFRLRDREFGRSDIEVEYGLGTGFDLDGDGEEDIEWFTASEVPFDPGDPTKSSSGKADLPGSPGIGTIHYFIWDSLTDLGTGRYVTQDYVYTDDGRVLLDEFGEPVFQDFAGTRVKIRPISRGVPGSWKETNAFDVNSNNTPSTSFGAVEIPPEGEADGTVNEDVVLNWTAIDPDDDPVTIAVDWVQVPFGFDPAKATEATLEALPWQAGSTGQIGEGTKSLPAARTPGLDHVWSWDSVADAGTMNGYVFFRMRPLDEKLEVGEWDYMKEKFHLDNYTLFTDPDAQLPGPSAHGRAVLLEDTTVLYAGGTSDTAPAGTALIFYAGLSQTTKGTVAEIKPGLIVARMNHTATRLADGTVLITGGIGAGDTTLNSAEIYDPLLKKFTLLAAKMTAPRRNHTATLLRGGRVLFAGGENVDGRLLSAEIYDPTTGKFADAGKMGVARTNALAARLPAGRVLIVGGTGVLGTLDSVEIYDPLAEAFLATDDTNSMTDPRVGHTLTETLNDPFAAVAAGGVNVDPHASIERFDWEQDFFETSSVMMQDPRADHLGVLLGDGKLLFAGGTMNGQLSPTGDIYDVDSDTMDIPNGDMVVPVAYAAVSCLENGRPVIFGGRDTTGQPTAQIQIFTPDGGFNYPPVAQILTPTSVEPWAFGVRFNWRATDQEGDSVKINAQFRIKPSDTDDSDVLPSELLDVWLPASMKDKTVLGEVSSGLTGLSSRKDFVTQLENPIDAPDVDPGEHLFVWYTEQDIPKGNYDNVFFRIEIRGATQGSTAASGRFSITDNAPTIARVQTPLTSHGHMVFPVYLQDSDSGDLARVVWEYGIDLNGDGKIVEADFETWVTLSRSKVSVDVGGTTYTDAGLTDLVTGTEDPDPNNDYTDSDGIPWGKLHHMVWDSVYDLGAPVETRSDVIVKCTPYDYPAGAPSDETLGIANTKAGFDLMQDPNGLYLDSWQPTVNNGAGSTYTFEGVKLDEPITFTFTLPVDDTTVSRDSIQVTKIGGIGQRIAGYFHVDNSSGKGVVTFYPQVQEIPARTDILEETVGYQLYIPTYDPTNRAQAVVQQDGADPDDTNGRYCLEIVTNDAALETGTGVLADSSAPNAGPLVKPTTTVDVATDTEIEVSFDERIASSSVTAAGFLVTAQVFAGVDSIVYGDLQLRNITDQSGIGGTIRQYAVLVFAPDTRLPADTSKIIIKIETALTDLAGNNLASSATSSFTTRSSTATVSGSFSEPFDDDTHRDGSLTSAFWGTTDPDGIGDGGGIGVKGYLTGMHDLGDGSDGTLDFSKGDVTIDTDTQDELNLTSLHIPEGRSLILKGSKPMILKIQGDVLIEGTLDAAGSPGDRGGGYYDHFVQSGGDGAQGGRGGPGGGVGGDIGNYTWKQTTKVTSTNGSVGYGAGTNSNGKAGTGALYLYGSSYDTYGAGASGAGHVQKGEDGSYGFYSGTFYKTPAKGGDSYGSTDLSNGLEAGSGGGGGGSVTVNYAYGTSYIYERWGLDSGGGGGGGGGALKMSVGGVVTVTKEGRVLANGGDGGHCGNGYPYGTLWYTYWNSLYTKTKKTVYGTYYRPGGGGGGSGGTLWLQAGSGFQFHGALDVSGGIGGIATYYLSGAYGYNGMAGYGGDGRLRLEGPGTIDLTKGVDFKGVVAAGENLAISGGSNSTNWTVSGSTTVNTDTGSGRPSGVDFTGGKFYAKDFTVNSGVTLRVSGSKPFVVYASGKVKIDGIISAVGSAPTTYTGGGTGSNLGWRMYSRLYGAAGVGGGGNGGDNSGSNWSSYLTTLHRGTDGYGTNGAVGGTGAGKASKARVPFKNDYESMFSASMYYHYYYEFYYFGGGGGGGGSGEVGGAGHPLMSSWGSRKHVDTQGVGGSRIVAPDSLTASNIHGGGGGGGGSLGGYFYRYDRYNTSGTITYTYQYYYGYGMSTPGGGGGGGVAITSSETIAMGAKGKIDTRGGHGGDRTQSAYYSVGSGPGGGGGAGSVLLEAKKGFSLTAGATIDASGGAGGRAYYSYSFYKDPEFSYGGDGARGSIVLRAEKKPEFLNLGQAEMGAKGTASTGGFLLTQDGVSTWQDTGLHAPKFLSLATTGDGIADLFIAGAMIDPMTGKVDALTATDWLSVADMSNVNGYRFFRFKAKLTGSQVSGKVPEIDSVDVAWETKQ